MSVPAPANFDADHAENLEDMERQFAVKAVQHMTTYWSILEKMRGSKLRLTKLDEEIYDHFKKTFPSLDVSKPLDENSMKSKEGKEKWRNFMMQYENKVEDYNFGTMLRTDCKAEYTEKETIFAVRMQFYAIEIARNKQGLNDWVYEKNHPESKT